MILNNLPLVSVVFTTFNRSYFLSETIHNIAYQTYPNIEILIVDDGSFLDIAKDNKTICLKYPNCQYFYKPNTGQPDSRNYGIKRANGDFIGFCDDDDVWILDKLEK